MSARKHKKPSRKAELEARLFRFGWNYELWLEWLKESKMRTDYHSTGRLDTDLPLVTTISESRPLAQTEHRCTVCGHMILRGTRYSRTLLRNDDAINPKKSLQVVKWHLPYCPEVSQ
jgi:hypothetical protein